MKRHAMLWGAALALGISLLTGASSEAATPATLSWDGYVEVHALPVGPGKWLTCPRGTTMNFGSSTPVKMRECLSEAGTIFTPKRASAPVVVGLQELLDMTVDAPAGFRLEAVGPMPNDYRSAKGMVIAFRYIPLPPKGSA